MVIPCLAGISEDVRRVCRKFNIRVVFRSRRTLRSMFTMVKDKLPIGTLVQCGISYPLQLWPCLHQGDKTEIGDETEGKQGCLRERDDGEVSCSGSCMGESPPDPLGGDHSAGPWQRK